MSLLQTKNPSPSKKGAVRVIVSNMAWVDQKGLTVDARLALQRSLTVIPQEAAGFGGAEPPRPIFLFDALSRPGWFGIARDYYLHRRKAHHDVRFDLVTNREALPSRLRFDGALRPDQQCALDDLLVALSTDRSNVRHADPAEVADPTSLGGFLQAPTGYGKSVWVCALIAALNVPTLIIVHREHLLEQWRGELERFLPGVEIGVVRGPKATWQGKHVVLGMLQTLCRYSGDDPFVSWPGLVVADEGHRLSARTWAEAIPKFRARWRVAVTATPKRKDKTEEVFHSHIGPILHRADVIQLLPQIKPVQTTFTVPFALTWNEGQASKLMIANEGRNRQIVRLVVQALRAGRTPFVLSKRRTHLVTLQALFTDAWLISCARRSTDPALVQAAVCLGAEGPETPAKETARDDLRLHFEVPQTAMCVGGISKGEMEAVKTTARVVFATAQFVAEAFNVPRLDTLFLTMPMVDVEQAVGRILRRCEGKKEPWVVDMRDDAVGFAKKYGEKRDHIYASLLDRYAAIGVPAEEE
jgi:hypothetical protein